MFIAHRLVTSTPCFLHVLVPETLTCFFLFCFLFSIPVAKRSSALRVCRVPRDQLSIKPHGQYRDFSVDGGSVLVSVLLCLFQTKNIAGAEHTSLPVNYLRKNPCDSNCKLQMCLWAGCGLNHCCGNWEKRESEKRRVHKWASDFIRRLTKTSDINEPKSTAAGVVCNQVH